LIFVRCDPVRGLTTTADLGEIDGVHAVSAGDVNEIFDA